MTQARILSVPIVAALLVASSGCSKKVQPRVYPFRGTVVKLDSNANVASIRNEKIDGWMEAMVMDYPVESKSEYLSLHKGEKITAIVHVTGEGYWLSNVKERQGE
jgi:Cu/Ag efflux protein CusF